MDNQPQNIPEDEALIDRFLLNQLSPAERPVFEERLTKDAALRQQVDEMRLLSVAIQESALRSQLDHYHQSVPAITISFWRRNRWLIAAAFIGLMLLPMAWLLLRPSGPERLYNEFYRPDPGLMTTMGTSEQYTFEKAMIEYKTGNYRAALEAWKVSDRTADSDTLDYFIGSAYLALQQPATALPYFKKVAGRQESVFKGDACWYAGLALLQNGDTHGALFWLQRSSHPDKEALIRKLQK
jgi:tetratricopeptide (TPR) repeat protein